MRCLCRPIQFVFAALDTMFSYVIHMNRGGSGDTQVLNVIYASTILLRIIKDCHFENIVLSFKSCWKIPFKVVINTNHENFYHFYYLLFFSTHIAYSELGVLLPRVFETVLRRRGIL